jgi:hypothetical protein
MGLKKTIKRGAAACGRRARASYKKRRIHRGGTPMPPLPPPQQNAQNDSYSWGSMFDDFNQTPPQPPLNRRKLTPPTSDPKPLREHGERGLYWQPPAAAAALPPPPPAAAAALPPPPPAAAALPTELKSPEENKFWYDAPHYKPEDTNLLDILRTPITVTRPKFSIKWSTLQQIIQQNPTVVLNIYNVYIVGDIENFEPTQNINFRECTFFKANLNNCRFNDSNFEQAEFMYSTLNNCRFERANMKSCNFYQTNITDCVFEGTDMSSAKFKHSDDDVVQNKSVFQNVTFHDTDISAAYFSNIDFRQCDFSGVRVVDYSNNIFKLHNCILDERTSQSIPAGTSTIVGNNGRVLASATAAIGETSPTVAATAATEMVADTYSNNTLKRKRESGGGRRRGRLPKTLKKKINRRR